MSGYTPRRTVFTPVSTHRIHGVAKKGAAEAQNQAQQKDAKGGSEWHEWTTNPEGTRVLPFHAKRDLSLQKDKAEGEGFEPSVTCATPVFKFGVGLNRPATSSKWAVFSGLPRRKLVESRIATGSKPDDYPTVYPTPSALLSRRVAGLSMMPLLSGSASGPWPPGTAWSPMTGQFCFLYIFFLLLRTFVVE